MSLFYEDAASAGSTWGCCSNHSTSRISPGRQTAHDHHGAEARRTGVADQCASRAPRADLNRALRIRAYSPACVVTEVI